MKKILAIAAIIRAARNVIDGWDQAIDDNAQDILMDALRARLEDYDRATSRGDSTDA